MSKRLKEPTVEEQRAESAIVDDAADYAYVRNRRYRIKYIKAGTRHKITQIVNAKGDDDRQSCKCAALMVLNGFWSILFRYGFLWRWFYYVRQYGEEELTDLLVLGKKKVPRDEYFANTMLLTALRDTSMMMTKTEVAHILQERSTEEATK